MDSPRRAKEMHPQAFRLRTDQKMLSFDGVVGMALPRLCRIAPR